MGVAGGDVALEVSVAEIQIDEEVVPEMVAEDGFSNEEVGGDTLTDGIVEFLFSCAVVEVDIATPVGIAAVSSIQGAYQVEGGMDAWQGLGLDP